MSTTLKQKAKIILAAFIICLITINWSSPVNKQDSGNNDFSNNGVIEERTSQNLFFYMISL